MAVALFSSSTSISIRPVVLPNQGHLVCNHHRITLPELPATPVPVSACPEVFVETAVAVFSTRGRAEEAVKELLENHVPEKSIVYLTRSENEAKTVGKQFGAVAG